MEREEYETLAAVETHHWWHRGMRAIGAALLDPLYGSRRDLKILDAGCGTGGTTAWLQRYGQVVGIDVAPEAISCNRLENNLIQGSVVSLPFADHCFDLVTSFDVLYHRGVHDQSRALREAHRVLRPGGRLLIRLPAYNFLRSKHDRAVHTRQRYTMTQVRSLLTATGFFIEFCTYINTLLFPLVLVQRLLERVWPTLERPQSDLSIPSPLFNWLLHIPLAIEAEWVRMRGKLPFGLSILCLAHSGKIALLNPEHLL